jgi:hypothetical protein
MEGDREGRGRKRRIFELVMLIEEEIRAGNVGIVLELR